MPALARIMLGLLAAALPLASAQAQRAGTSIYAKAGAFFPRVDSTLRIDGSGGLIGSEIDLETDLGLATSKALPFGLVGWRFSDNWRAEVEYFKLARDSTKTIDKTLTIGDTTFPVNGSVTSGLSTSVWRTAIGYSFARSDRYEFGANLGLHLSNFGVFVEGRGTVAGVSGSLRNESRNQLVPLPTLGLYGSFDLNDTLAIVGRINYFQLKVGNYKGALTDASIGLTAQINRNFGIGADFRYVDYRLRAQADDFTGRVNYNFYGPFVYVIAGF